jgi:hypothetical protein
MPLCCAVAISIIWRFGFGSPNASVESSRQPRSLYPAAKRASASTFRNGWFHMSCMGMFLVSFWSVNVKECYYLLKSAKLHLRCTMTHNCSRKRKHTLKQPCSSMWSHLVLIFSPETPALNVLADYCWHLYPRPLRILPHLSNSSEEQDRFLQTAGYYHARLAQAATSCMAD